MSMIIDDVSESMKRTGLKKMSEFPFDLRKKMQEWELRSETRNNID
jgi:hypothetical protein